MPVPNCCSLVCLLLNNAGNNVLLLTTCTILQILASSMRCAWLRTFAPLCDKPCICCRTKLGVGTLSCFYQEHSGHPVFLNFFFNTEDIVGEQVFPLISLWDLAEVYIAVKLGLCITGQLKILSQVLEFFFYNYVVWFGPDL